MSSVTLTPDYAATLNGLPLALPSGTILAAITDTSDSTYVARYALSFTEDSFSVGFPASGMPDGAVGIRWSIVMRTSSGLGGTIWVQGTPGLHRTNVSVTWPSPTTTTAVTRTAAFDESMIDALGIEVGWSSGGVSIYQLYAVIVYVAKPVATVTAPTGTLTTTNRPALTWTTTLDGDGGAQTAFQAQILDGATIVEDSGITAGAAATWTPTGTLDDGSYTARVRVAQTVNGSYHWSDWDTESFSVLVDLPGAPTLTVTPDASSGWFELDIADTTGAATTDAFQIQRSTDGATWATVRVTDSSGRLPAATESLVDWEAPIGTPVTYRARALHNYSGEYAESAWTTASAATLDTSSWWIRHPYDYTLGVAVGVNSFPAITRQARQTSTPVLGRPDPVFVFDERASITGTIRLHLQTASDRAKLDALLDAGSPLLLHGPVADGWDAAYVVFGDHNRPRAADKSFVTDTLDELPFAVVAWPAGVVLEWPASS